MRVPSRSVRTHIVWGLALAAASVAAAGVTPDSHSPRHMVLVTIPAVRHDRATDGGRMVLPRMMEIARGGALYTRCRTPVPDALPALGSLMTAVGPHEHGIYPGATPEDTPVTLGSVLSDNGFAALVSHSDPAIAATPALLVGLTPVAGPAGADPVGRARRAIEVMAGRAKETRVFTWIHIEGPGAPYTPDPQVLATLAADGTNDVWDFPLPLVSRSDEPDGIPTAAAMGKERSAARYLDAYDAELLAADRAIGAAWDVLGEAGLQEETLFVVASLHGESHGEHGIWFANGHSLHEEEVLVPLLFRATGVNVAQDRTTPISLVDVPATAAALLAVDHPFPAEWGRNMAPRMAGSAAAPQRVHFGALVRPPFSRSVVVDDRFKLILTPARPAGIDLKTWPAERRRELFDLKRDPLEGRPANRVWPGKTNEILHWLETQYPPLPGTPPARDRRRRR